VAQPSVGSEAWVEFAVGMGVLDVMRLELLWVAFLSDI